MCVFVCVCVTKKQKTDGNYIILHYIIFQTLHQRLCTLSQPFVLLIQLRLFDVIKKLVAEMYKSFHIHMYSLEK